MAAVWLAVWPLVVVLSTVSLTVQHAGYYEEALSRADVYDRLYTEVLTDPQIVEVTDQLLGRLPVDRSVVTANLRVVLPPAALRGVAHDVAAELAGYCSGDGGQLRLTVDLLPVFENISRLVSVYLLGELSQARTYTAGDVAVLVRDVLAGAADLARGRVPASVPTLALSPAQAASVAAAMVRLVPAGDRTPLLARQVRVLLVTGDLRGALALIGPLVFRGADQAIADLQRRVRGRTVDLGVPFAPASDTQPARILRAVHRLGSPGVIGLAVGMAVVLLAGLVLVVALERRRGGRPTTMALTVLLTGGAAGVTAVLVLRRMIQDALGQTAVSDLPPGLRQVADDVLALLVGRFSEVALRITAVPLVCAALLAVGLVALAPETDLGNRGIARAAGTRRRIGQVMAATVGVSVLLWLLVPTGISAGTQVCNGSAQLCSRRYDQVTYPASHNAMAASQDDFLGPDQDLDLIGQLNLGIRALLIDVHTWSTPTQVAQFLNTLPPAERAVIEPFTRGATRPRAGLWLCHNVCQLGSLELTAQLHRLRHWLDANPREVLTLIVQDQAPAAQIMAAFADAGLSDYPLTPPEPPDRSWPTLADMIDSGHRLVVLTERQDQPGTAFRRLFRYVSDTSFRVRNANGFTCAPNRGDVTAPLLLINHWVARTSGSRYAASVVNTRRSLLAHVRLCQAARLRRPTFVAVDFVSIGDLVATVAELNDRPLPPDAPTGPTG